ncbi:hypothetical protein RJ639_040637 [Escallonia herrerae]|uniref:RING-type E3 ubiquitin transferase n=1 Tax=Escallonia herrerae TaxID=1293975 RepID=A0AA89BA45_9ASTE|nr:hypothetical protein RJ639_040637 [Escallonia herrerae]
MKIPCCSVCQNRYNEEERCPLLLQCGHGFCKDCLSRLFAASTDTTLSCPRCRHVSTVGNSVQGLKKNYAILGLIHSSNPSFDRDFTDDEDDDDEDDDDEETRQRRQSSRQSQSSGCGGGRAGGDTVIELASHQDLRLVRRIGEGRRNGVEMWTAVLSGGARRCRHRVAVKKVVVGEDIDSVWVQGQLESLRRSSMWCRNVCTFHGATRTDGCLALVMDKCKGSVLTEMQRNEGRLTLEQILRFFHFIVLRFGYHNLSSLGGVFKVVYSRKNITRYEIGTNCGFPPYRRKLPAFKLQNNLLTSIYGADIARGVAELHAAGVVCMNLKPSNLLLDANGRAVVSDYGLPAILKKPGCRKARAECDSSRIHSCMDCTMLSPNYTAPEAWEQPVKKPLNLFWDDAIGISAESDAWSFGCTLVEMCTGSIPWAGLSSEEIYRAVVKARKQPPQYASVVGVGIPRELWKMIGECLQVKPSRRPTFNAMLTIFLRHLQEIPRSPPASPEKELLAKAASVNSGDSLYSLLEAQNADGQTALHLACRRGSVELVEIILDYKEANVDVLDKDGDPPLVFALAAGSPECVRALIRRHANVRSRLREGIGPSVAHVCAYHGQPDCMRELLLAGADPNAVDDEGETVLHRAITKKYTDCALVILENGGCGSMGILNSKDLTPLHLCIATWNVAVVKRWLELDSRAEIDYAIDLSSPCGTALCMAAALKKNHEADGRELVKILLAAGADAAAQDTQHGQTALHTAAMANDVELVKLNLIRDLLQQIILDAGVDVNVRNVQNTIPLHVALARGAKSCVGLLLSAGANCNLQPHLLLHICLVDMNDEGDNAFHIAADSAKMIRENLDWIIVMLRYKDAAVEVRNHRQVDA